VTRAVGLVLLAVGSLQVGAAVAALAGFAVLDQGLAARDWIAIGLVVIASAGASTLEE